MKHFITLFLFCVIHQIQAQILSPKLMKQPFLQEFVWVPTGTLHNISDKTIDTVNAFYASKYEISNAQYKLFLSETFDTASMATKSEIFVDSVGWFKESKFQEPYTLHYFRHIAYSNYPCVNISHRAAELYCDWLSKKLNALYPDYIFTVKLPDEKQWSYAARGGLRNSTFPWGGPYLMNEKGQYLCNYKHSPDAYVPKKRNIPDQLNSPNDNADIIAPVNAYLPNNYGIYNTSGNVAEMIADTTKAMGGDWLDSYDNVTTSSIKIIKTPNCRTGFRPIFTVYKK